MKDQTNARQRVIKDPLVGTTVDGRYSIVAAIGLGATSSVYKAEDLSTGRTVAVKLLHSHLASDDGLVSRFEREAQAAKILTHPNIVSVSEYAISDSGTPYLIMDYIEGLSLQQLLAKERWLPVPVALPITTQICAALNEAHQKGIVHRDIKPGNIMLMDRPDGSYFVKILDFGCAQMMPMLGDTVLKLYMSPEQCLDEEVDGRSDCYSLGCVLYEILTGKPPLAARTAFETMNKQLSTMPDSLKHARPDLDLSKDLEKVIFKAMAKSPARRYQKITDLMDDLLKISNQKSPQHALAENGRPESGATRYEPIADLKHRSTHYSPDLQTTLSRGEVLGIRDEANRVENQPLPLVTSFRTVGAVSMATTFVVVSLLLLAALLKATLLILLCFGGVAFVLVKGAKINKTANPDDSVRRGEAQIIELKAMSIATDPLLRMDTSFPFIPALMTKNDVKVYTAQKRNDASIELEIADQSLNRQKILIRPIESHSHFWRNFCGESQDFSRAIEFPVDATIVNIDTKNISYLVMQEHLSVILP
jgi:serine/threonine protein kinase